MKLPPLEDDVRSLLDAERRAIAPQAALDRAWGRLQAGAVVPANIAAPTLAPTRAAAGLGRLTLTGWKVPAGLSLAFALGVASGISVRSRQGTAPAAPLVSHRPALAPAGALPPRIPPADPLLAPSPRPSISVTNPPVAMPTAPAPSRSPAVASAHSNVGSSLKAERALLDSAHASLSEGDAAHALGLTETHQRLFPHAQLAEEREALAIQALAMSHKYDEARARAGRFRSQFPTSLFLPAVLASIESIP